MTPHPPTPAHNYLMTLCTAQPPGPLEKVSLSVDAVSEHFLNRIPRDFARAHLIVSQGVTNDNVERLAIADTSNQFAVHNVGTRLERKIEVVVADSETIAKTIDDAYGRAKSLHVDGQREDASVAGDHARQIDTLLAHVDRDLLSTQGKGQIVKLVDALLFEALFRGASDVHIQPLDDRTLVRYRLDGVLHNVRELPPTVAPSVISRIKVMGRMDIAEKRVPQDGRATVTIGIRPIDLRLSTLPTSYGERAVIRLLDHAQQLADFESLGMPPEVATPYLHCAQRNNGIVLLTGPTGSGKTTTLYATLRRIGSAEVNIMTIEDPIEYDLSASGAGLVISQSQVNLKKGITFASGLRHILRQDPDVVMVGEIRDTETAKIAIQSSLTGHLVFSTLHTNDASAAVTRLVDLGVEPYLVSASLNAVLAQRLVRHLHQSCGGTGCEECLHTGYRGRTGLFELLVINEAIRALIARDGDVQSIREAALHNGMKSLHDEAMRLVGLGVTSALEAERVVQEVF